jgi:hypothetical protein
MTTNSFIGQIDLLALVGAQVVKVNGQDCIAIPIQSNPSIFMCQSKTGQPKGLLDIFVRETTNSQYGNSHFVKASVGKSNREKLALSKDDLARVSPIIGNIRPYSGTGQPVQSQAPVQDDDDLPPDTFKGF